MENLKKLPIVAAFITIANFSISIILGVRYNLTNLPDFLKIFNVDSLIIKVLVFFLLEIIISYLSAKILLKAWHRIIEFYKYEFRTYYSVNRESYERTLYDGPIAKFNGEIFVFLIITILTNLIISAWLTVFNISFLFLSGMPDSSQNRLGILILSSIAAVAIYAIIFSAEASNIQEYYYSKKRKEAKKIWNSIKEKAKKDIEEKGYLTGSLKQHLRLAMDSKWDEYKYRAKYVSYDDSIVTGCTIKIVGLAFVLILQYFAGEL